MSRFSSFDTAAVNLCRFTAAFTFDRYGTPLRVHRQLGRRYFNLCSNRIYDKVIKRNNAVLLMNRKVWQAVSLWCFGKGGDQMSALYKPRTLHRGARITLCISRRALTLPAIRTCRRTCSRGQCPAGADCNSRIQHCGRLRHGIWLYGLHAGISPRNHPVHRLDL